MICWGVFLPRSSAATTRITVTMAAALIFCHGLVLHHADTVDLAVDDVAGHQIVMANALFLIMGVVLATLAAWALRGREGADGGRDSGPAGLGRVGPYRLLRSLGDRGVGHVYLAEHDDLGRPCAIKLVRPGDRVATARFDREVQAAARLLHPNTVSVFDFGRTGDGTAYCAMEFLPGLCVADIVGIEALLAKNKVHRYRGTGSSSSSSPGSRRRPPSPACRAAAWAWMWCGPTSRRLAARSISRAAWAPAPSYACMCP
jgi:serine/threonine-protein kinase